MSLFKSLQNNKLLLISTVGLTIILIIGQWLQQQIVFDRNAIDLGQWWKIVSGNFTHSNLYHLLLNLSGVWLLVLLFVDTLKLKTFILSTLILSLVVGFGLFFLTPEINKYYGFSGILYGLYFIAAISAILHGDKFTGISVALLISAKIIWDYFSGGSQSSAELIGIPVANDAHLYGFIGSLGIALFLVINNRINSN